MEKTKEELLEEIWVLERRVAELEGLGQDLKRADALLKGELDNWQATFDAVQDLIMLLDKDYRIIRVNSAVGSFLQLSPEKIVGEYCYKLMHGTDVPAEICPLATLKQTGKRAQVELYFPQRKLWFWVSVDPIFNKQGNLSGVVHILRDITAYKEAQDLLIQEKKKSQKYFDAAAVIMLVLDIEGKVVLINSKGSDVLGYEKKEIEGKDWFDNFIPERLRSEMRLMFGRLKKGEEGLFGYYENPVLAKGNKERLIGWSNTILRDSTGVITTILSSGEDVAERQGK
jgi:PAS domain S-box-containing protein